MTDLGPVETRQPALSTDRASILDLTPKERAAYGMARSRYLMFDAIHDLWARRKAEGMSVEQLAERCDRSVRWTRRALSGPGQWTLKTFGALLEALDGELVMSVLPDEGNLIQALDDRLHYKSRFLSSINRMTKFPEYGKLLDQGEETVRFILREMWLHNVRVYWFGLLRQLTGANPVPDEERGRVRKMRERWVNWGIANGWFGNHE